MGDKGKQILERRLKKDHSEDYYPVCLMRKKQKKKSLLQISIYLFSHLLPAIHINKFSGNNKQTELHFSANVKYY